LAPSNKKIKRKTYDFFGAFGYIGGLWFVFIYFGNYFIIPFA